MKKIMFKISLLIIIFGASSCYESTKLDTELSDLYKDLVVTSSSYQLLADSSSIATIEARIPENAPTENSNITFKVYGASFIDSPAITQKIVRAKRLYENNSWVKSAQIRLKLGNRIGTAFIDVTYGSARKKIELRLVKAFPENIKIILPTDSIIHGYQPFKFHVSVFRDMGVPSAGSNIYLSAIDSTGNSVGQFLNGDTYQLKNKNIQEIIYSMGTDTCACKRISITAQTLDVNQDTIKDTKTLTLK